MWPMSMTMKKMSISRARAPKMKETNKDANVGHQKLVMVLFIKVIQRVLTPETRGKELGK